MITLFANFISKYHLEKKILLLLLSFDICFVSSYTEAQTVEKVVKNQTLISSGTIQLKVGDELQVLNKAGEKTGLVKVKKVTNNRAIAFILQGTVEVGQNLALSLQEPAPGQVSEETKKIETKTTETRKAYGFTTGLGIDSISLTAADSYNPPLYKESVKLAGSHFSLKGFYDYPLSKYVLRFSSGLDGFNGNYSARSTSINNDGSETSKLNIMALAFDGEVLWNFYNKSLNTVWISGGYSFQYGVGSSSNLNSLKASSYSNIFFFGVGANINMSLDSFLPVFFRYSYYMNDASITQTSAAIGAGWGWTL